MKHYVFVNYTKSTLDNHFSASGKAFYLDYDNGKWTGNNNHVWIPKSICKFSEVNEVGNLQIMIPYWFFDKNCLDYHRIENFSKVEFC